MGRDIGRRVMIKLKVERKVIEAYGRLEVTVGTNCPQGGDAGNGGRTLLQFCGSSMQVKFGDDKYIDIENVAILVGGDSECETLLEALQFATEKLEHQLQYNRSKDTVVVD